MTCENQSDAESLEQAARDPKSIAGDQGQVTEHSLPDRIALDEYLAKKRRGRTGTGIRRQRIIPPDSRGFRG